MAITVDIKLNELEKGSGNYSVTAKITDDAKPVGEQEVIINDILSTRIDTPEQKKSIWDDVIKYYNAKITAVRPTADVEAEGKSYIEKGI